jgi:hypothetical protein
MNMYNVVFQQDELAWFYAGLIASTFGDAPTVKKLTLEETKEDVLRNFGRFRDAWLEKHGDEIWVRIHTRNGGNNRPDYQSQIDRMRQHPWFVKDEDMEFDNTYADFYFRIPALLLEDDSDLLSLAVEPVDMVARWFKAVDDLVPPIEL